jgi:hypothetical protein
MKERMLVHAAEVVTSSRDEFTTMVREDLAKWTRIKASAARGGT